jgi:hypothetical protein
MTKKLTKIVEDARDKLVNISETLKSKDYDFSSPQALERIKKIRETQKEIRKSIMYTKYDLDKASGPYSRPYSH